MTEGNYWSISLCAVQLLPVGFLTDCQSIPMKFIKCKSLVVVDFAGKGPCNMLYISSLETFIRKRVGDN